MENFKFLVPALLFPKRLDVYLVEALGAKVSRENLKEAILSGEILLNGRAAKPSVLVKEGNVLEGSLKPKKTPVLEAEAIPLKVIYEDEWIIVIDKPAGMVVHPGAGNRKGTLVHALLGRGTAGLAPALSQVGGPERPGIVHRLDKNTSGLLVVAKTNEAHRHLQNQFAERGLSKTYTAFVYGRVELDTGRMEFPIGRHPKIREKMAVLSEGQGKEAFTQYRVLQRFPRHTLLEVKILTGRTHQIRVHLAHLGNPVVGDPVYGKRKDAYLRHALHASKLEFIHPNSGKLVKFSSKLPSDFEEIMKNEISND
jgi:23S rRNA pseudouridine1911/1915/1917 synthase